MPLAFLATQDVPLQEVPPAHELVAAGQSADVPSQLSEMLSQPPAGWRQTPDVRKRSVGQSRLVPSQLSAASQAPSAGRQTVPRARTSVGQAADTPLHVS